MTWPDAIVLISWFAVIAIVSVLMLTYDRRKR